MKQKEFLKSFSEIADIQAKRLQTAIQQVKPLLPFTSTSFKDLDNEHLAYLDMLTTRFSKLQDILGRKIFTLILEILGEEAPAFIDKLNKLEKLGFIEEAHWWITLREMRNQLTHDYPNNYETLATHVNAFIEQAEALCTYWTTLKTKLTTLP